MRGFNFIGNAIWRHVPRTDRLNVFHIIGNTWCIGRTKTQYHHYGKTGVLHLNDKKSWNKVVNLVTQMELESLTSLAVWMPEYLDVCQGIVSWQTTRILARHKLKFALSGASNDNSISGYQKHTTFFFYPYFFMSLFFVPFAICFERFLCTSQIWFGKLMIGFWFGLVWSVVINLIAGA